MRTLSALALFTYLLPLLSLPAFAKTVPAAGSGAARSGTGSAGGGFEGRIAMKLSLEQGQGDMVFSVAPQGTRVDMKMNLAGFPQALNLAILLKSDQLGKAYMVNEAQKSYSEIDLAEASRLALKQDSLSQYTVKVLGKTPLLGYSTQEVLLTRKGESTRLWVAKDIDVYQTFKRLQSINPQMGGDPALFQALEKAGVTGFPLRTVVIRDGDKVELAATSVQKKKMNASLFEIPAGFTKSEGFPGMPGGEGGPTPEQIEKIKKALEESNRAK